MAWEVSGCILDLMIFMVWGFGESRGTTLAKKKRRKIHSGLFAPLLILKEQHKYSSRASRQELCKSIRQPTLSLSTVCDRMWQKAGGKMLNYEDTAANKSTSLLLFSSCSGCRNKSVIYLFHIRLYSNELEHIKHG